MIRYVEGWQLHSYVEHGVDGPEGLAISARHLARDIFRVNRFDLTDLPSGREATEFIDSKLFAVIGVTDDGRIFF
ncbi:hypothetical protein [Stenotrophomonas pigmentata]|uniref:hypothetical protein n=1 Tax=Stenotrophomonas pigmentata TaxID=3055080 RepID=UPI0026EEC3A9|nr:hypothetical protein [Stenotrophomonas sp. 610A2]